MDKTVRRTRFTAFDVDLWGKPKDFKDAVRSLVFDNPFGFWFNLGFFNFSIGFVVFGIGLTVGLHSPFYCYLKLEGLGFDADFSTGFYHYYDYDLPCITTGAYKVEISEAQAGEGYSDDRVNFNDYIVGLIKQAGGEDVLRARGAMYAAGVDPDLPDAEQVLAEATASLCTFSRHIETGCGADCFGRRRV